MASATFTSIVSFATSGCSGGDSRLGCPPGRSPAEVPRSVSTIVVNDNAAAVLLALNTLAEGGEVIVSRGELVEIGGSFRIPDVMAKWAQHSAKWVPPIALASVTTKQPLPSARGCSCACTDPILRSPALPSRHRPRIGRVARQRGLPLMEDLGSGALVNLQNFGISGEASVLDSLHAGVDIVTYSGDKLLGGPQACRWKSFSSSRNPSTNSNTT